MDSVKVTLGNRRTAAEAALQCTKDRRVESLLWHI